jgi:hypothetical protein
VALLVHFNLRAAMVVTGAVHCICFFLQLFYNDHPWFAPLTVPQPRVTDLVTCDGCRTALLCESLGPLAFFITLATAHRFRPGWRPPISLFLDICCIAQDDEAAKAVGIQSIGAILDRSQRMLALVSADYFDRLWCTFELAAYHKRAGRSRLDLVPLSAPLRFFGFALTFLVFYELTFLSTYAAELLSDSDSPFAVFVTGGGSGASMGVVIVVLVAPGLLLLLYAAVEAQEVHDGLMRLHRFDLVRDARCFSPADREALLDIIGDWFSDTSSGEKDTEGLRQLGIHRFESFVRFELAPELTGGGGGSSASSAARGLGVLETVAMLQLCIVGWLLDTWSMPGLAVGEVWPLLAMGAFAAAVMFPSIEWMSHYGSLIVRARREQWGGPLAYAVAFVAVTPIFGVVGMMLWTLPGPSLWGLDIGGEGADSEWDAGTSADDGLDPIGRKVRKWQAFLVVAFLAVAWARFAFHM